MAREGSDSLSIQLIGRTHWCSTDASAFVPVDSGVTHGSVLGPVFSMYIKPLSIIIDSHFITRQSFADDLQLQMSVPPDKMSKLIHSLQQCIGDIEALSTTNMLKLNDNKS